MLTSVNLHHANRVSATIMDCKGENGRPPFTTLSLCIRGDDGQFHATIFGLDPAYAKRLAAAISAVDAEDKATEEADAEDKATEEAA